MTKHFDAHLQNIGKTKEKKQMNKKMIFGTLLLTVMALVLIPQGSAATLDGAAIYAAKCQMCHGVITTHSMIPSGITAAQITAAFAPGGKMDGKGVTLLPGEAQAIADAITPPAADDHCPGHYHNWRKPCFSNSRSAPMLMPEQQQNDAVDGVVAVTAVSTVDTSVENYTLSPIQQQIRQETKPQLSGQSKS